PGAPVPPAPGHGVPPVAAPPVDPGAEAAAPDAPAAPEVPATPAVRASDEAAPEAPQQPASCPGRCPPLHAGGGHRRPTTNARARSVRSRHSPRTVHAGGVEPGRAA